MSDASLPALLIVPPGIYRHYKGERYQVIDTVRHSETLESLTLYRPLYGEQALWVRPSAMFAGMIEFEGRLQRRFAPLADTPA